MGEGQILLNLALIAFSHGEKVPDRGDEGFQAVIIFTMPDKSAVLPRIKIRRACGIAIPIQNNFFDLQLRVFQLTLAMGF